MLAMERCRYSAGALRRSAAARSTVRPAGTYPLSGSCADVWAVSASGPESRKANGRRQYREERGWMSRTMERTVHTRNLIETKRRLDRNIREQRVKDCKDDGQHS